MSSSDINDLNPFKNSEGFCVTQASLLVYLIINAPTSLMVDTSDVAIGGVPQTCLNGIWSPIAFFSRRLTSA